MSEYNFTFIGAFFGCKEYRDYLDQQAGQTQPASQPTATTTSTPAPTPTVATEASSAPWVKGSPSYVRKTEQMLDRCKRSNPQWYAYICRLCCGFQEGSDSTDSGYYSGTGGKCVIMFNPATLAGYSLDEYEDTTVHELRHFENPIHSSDPAGAERDALEIQAQCAEARGNWWRASSLRNTDPHYYQQRDAGHVW